MTLLLHPVPLGTALTEVLDQRAYEWVGARGRVQAEAQEPNDGFTGMIVTVSEGIDATDLCRWFRDRYETAPPILALVSAESLDDLRSMNGLIDDFCLMPFHPLELLARLDLLSSEAETALSEPLISYGPLRLNVETYQAAVGDRALDLTYMEYELLRFLASSPGKVFSREVLLSEVWGYDYYGGARTVDVHVRRLRSKLGEEHASMISTVRSVGYRLGDARWSS